MLYCQKISLIIPCKNEEAALYSMLQKVPAYIDEVIVVDNGSQDNTYRVAQKLGVKVVREERSVGGIGYGYAHQKGMRLASGDIIVGMDGDDTYPLDEIYKVVTYLTRGGFDFVSCARFPLSDSMAISRTRQLGVWILNTMTSILYTTSVKDILSGMWVMRRECMPHLHARSGGWDFSPEIKLSAMTHPQIRFSEYHISHAERVNGVSKQNIWKTGIHHVFFILGQRLTHVQPGYHFVRFFRNQVVRAHEAIAREIQVRLHVPSS